MRLQFFLASTSLILATVVSCGDDSVVSPPAIIPVTVAFGDTAIVANQGASITFVGIYHDFRCQEEFPCQWEGGAEVALKVRIPSDTAEHWVLLPIMREADHTKSETLMPVDALGFRFTLLELSPYPRPTNDSEYVATIEMFTYDLPDTLDGRLTISDISPQDIKLNGFWLDTAYIENDRIHLTAKYSGGCMQHHFWLYMSPAAFAKSNPVQANLYLRHWSLFDPCAAIITEDLIFDLGPMIEMYRKSFGNDDDIIVNMYHYSDSSLPPVTVLRYYGADSL